MFACCSTCPPHLRRWRNRSGCRPRVTLGVIRAGVSRCRSASLSITWRRPHGGAASGGAKKFMSREDSRVAGILGTGLQARTQLEAIAQVRRFEVVRAFGRDPTRRADFCRDMSERLGGQVTPTASAEKAIRDADVVVTATNSTKPVLFGAWLVPGTHVNAMGANMAEKQEF